MMNVETSLTGWNTDAEDFGKAVAEFEAALPGFWWSVGQCSVGAHASCAVDGNGSQAALLEGVKAGEPLDEGFHVDTSGGSPSEALRHVMRQALEYLQKEQGMDQAEAKKDPTYCDTKNTKHVWEDVSSGPRWATRRCVNCGKGQRKSLSEQPWIDE